MPVNTRSKNYAFWYCDDSYTEESDTESSFCSDLSYDDFSETIIISSRTCPRVKGKICVRTIVDGVYKPTPLEDFIDPEGFFTNQEICNWVNDWNLIAAKYPNTKRRCLFCPRKTNKGLTICWSCKFKGMEEIVYA